MISGLPLGDRSWTAAQLQKRLTPIDYRNGFVHDNLCINNSSWTEINVKKIMTRVSTIKLISECITILFSAREFLFVPWDLDRTCSPELYEGISYYMRIGFNIWQFHRANNNLARLFIFRRWELNRFVKLLRAPFSRRDFTEHEWIFKHRKGSQHQRFSYYWKVHDRK